MWFRLESEIGTALDPWAPLPDGPVRLFVGPGTTLVHVEGCRATPPSNGTVRSDDGIALLPQSTEIGITLEEGLGAEQITLSFRCPGFKPIESSNGEGPATREKSPTVPCSMDAELEVPGCPESLADESGAPSAPTAISSSGCSALVLRLCEIVTERAVQLQNAETQLAALRSTLAGRARGQPVWYPRADAIALLGEDTPEIELRAATQWLSGRRESLRARLARLATVPAASLEEAVACSMALLDIAAEVGVIPRWALDAKMAAAQRSLYQQVLKRARTELGKGTP